MSRQTAELRERSAPVAQRHQPPFRAEHIASLLRPTALLEARAKFAGGEIGRKALIAAEDAAIEDALKLQERIGLKFAVWGET